MKKLLGFSLFFLALVTGTWAQSSLSSSIAELPQCALGCLISAIENSTCSVTNQTCICTNAPLQIDVTVCVEASCTLKEALVTKNVTQTTCGAPIRDKSGLYNTISNVFGAVSGAAVAIRLVSKFFTKSEVWLDDYFIAITLATGIPSSVLTVHGLTSNGLGKDIWTVTFKQITDFIHVFYVMEILYFAQVALLKLSLLFFYLRIFPGPKIRRLIWGTIIIDSIFGIVFVVASIFQCHPIDYYWKNWDGEHHGKCFDVNAMAWANAVISILLDAWMLGLPMSQVVKLNLHWKKKVGVASMFVVGTFVTVVSILRLQSIVRFAKSINPTRDNISVAQWSTVEINVGIICACMPSMRLLLVRLFPKILGSTQNSNKQYVNSHGRITGNSSLGRSDKISIPSEPDENTIVYSQTYTVRYGDPETGDEVQLVPLGDLDPETGKMSSRASVTEV
ncbi:related to integral membrane protein PTH11 [Phialocephala subalpina]|uniref:Related to integral membrane protein PTH11 n=1 Tax=Phialocephala subalpina TaxID=576137 RepID=A0A1L7XS01_9HELO|nr:related to integral membrane protein PTH11 [Phialocephala subalpina]